MHALESENKKEKSSLQFLTLNHLIFFFSLALLIFLHAIKLSVSAIEMVDAHDHRYTLARYLCDRTRLQHQPRPTSFHRENASPTLFSLFPRNRFDPRWPYFLLSLSPSSVPHRYGSIASEGPLQNCTLPAPIILLSLSLFYYTLAGSATQFLFAWQKLVLLPNFFFSSPLSLSLMGREIFVLSPISWIVH